MINKKSRKLIKEENIFDKDIINQKNEIKHKNILIKKSFNYNNYKRKGKKSYLKKKSLTEFNLSIKRQQLKYINTNNIFNLNSNIKDKEKKLMKNKSYDCLLNSSMNKNDKINYEKEKNDKENNIYNSCFNNNEICFYIKVNKKKINNNCTHNNNNNVNSIKKNEEKIINGIKSINIDNTNNEYSMESFMENNIENNENIDKNNKIIKNINNNITKNKNIKNKYKNKVINRNIKNDINENELNNKLLKTRPTALKKIYTNNNIINSNINKLEQIKKKPSYNNIDKNKIEHNIFLDKIYQNRFKKNQKNSSQVQYDIFTTDKQKEYNTFIVKKKSNYLNSLILKNKESNISNKNNKEKDWVYRLYNKEIKKQKIKNKIVLLLRKSILNDGGYKIKEINKSKKEIDNYKYPINEGYNIDDNFNIINLFLSDDKKRKKKNSTKKKKKIKKCQSFHSYRKHKRYSFDDYRLEDEKIDKLIEDKMHLKNYRSYKKFRFLYYNEELINEEDEEKEQEQEQEQEKDEEK